MEAEKAEQNEYEERNEEHKCETDEQDEHDDQHQHGDDEYEDDGVEYDAWWRLHLRRHRNGRRVGVCELRPANCRLGVRPAPRFPLRQLNATRQPEPHCNDREGMRMPPAADAHSRNFVFCCGLPSAAGHTSTPPKVQTHRDSIEHSSRPKASPT